MFLTRALLYYVKQKRIPGALYSGKHQLVKPITSEMKLRAVMDMLRERDNYDLLQNPFLTEEEEQCYHLADINREQELILDRHLTIQKKMLKHRLLGDHLEHLNVNKAWE